MPLTFARWALFLVYFWFGVLKIFSVSPASPLVSALLEKALPGVPMSFFGPAFGLFELALAVLFVIPKLTKLSVALTFFHLFMTVLPLVVLPNLVWSGWFVPTLEGQYIIKNVLIVAILLILAKSTGSSSRQTVEG